MHSQFQNRRADDGFTLIEIMVAALIIVIGLFAIITSFTVSLTSFIGDDTRTTALKVAERNIEYVRGLDYNQIGLESASSPDAIGILTATQIITSQDISFVRNKTFTVSRDVEWLDEPNSPLTDKDYKRYIVEVIWDKPNPGGKVRLTTDFQPTSVTTSLNQAPQIQFVTPQINNLTFCGSADLELFAVDPEDLSTIDVNIQITNTAFPSSLFMLGAADELGGGGTYDYRYKWDTSVATDSPTTNPYNMFAQATDTLSKINTTARTAYVDNTPAGWAGLANVVASYDGTKVVLTWSGATNDPNFFEYRLFRRNLTDSIDTTSEYFSSSILSSNDTTIEEGKKYEYIVQTRNGCGAIGASSMDASTGTAGIDIPATTLYDLTAGYTGSGSMDVKIGSDPTVYCTTGLCVYPGILAATQIILTPHNDPSLFFTNWATGPCGGTITSPCIFNISGNTTATATFSGTPPPTYTLTTRFTPSAGSSMDVTVGATVNYCTVAAGCAYPGITTGTIISLVPNPVSSYTFTSWASGPCASTTTVPCVFSISANTIARATYTPIVNSPPSWVAVPIFETGSAQKQVKITLHAIDDSAADIKYEIRRCGPSNNSSDLDTCVVSPIVPFPVVGASNLQIVHIDNTPDKNKWYKYEVRACDQFSLCTATIGNIRVRSGN